MDPVENSPAANMPPKTTMKIKSMVVNMRTVASTANSCVPPLTSANRRTSKLMMVMGTSMNTAVTCAARSDQSFIHSDFRTPSNEHLGWEVAARTPALSVLVVGVLWVSGTPVRMAVSCTSIISVPFVVREHSSTGIRRRLQSGS